MKTDLTIESDGKPLFDVETYKKEQLTEQLNSILDKINTGELWVKEHCVDYTVGEGVCKVKILVDDAPKDPLEEQMPWLVKK